MAHNLQDSYEDIPFGESETGSRLTPGSRGAQSASPPTSPPPPGPPPQVIRQNSPPSTTRDHSRMSMWSSCFPCRSMRSATSVKTCSTSDNDITVSHDGASKSGSEKCRREKSKSFGCRNNGIKQNIRDYVRSNKKSLKRPQENHVDSGYSDDNSNYPEFETISIAVTFGRNESRALPPLPSSSAESLSTGNAPRALHSLVSEAQPIGQNSDETSRSGTGPVANSAIHSQVEYQHHTIHCLSDIYSMACYWGVIDRYEAEAVLENKPEGCFLLRDSAQDDFVFSVSFRRFNRTLHARLEQQDHRFTFDSHDHNIFSANSISELLEHYKDPANCMIYEPMCCTPVHRNHVFSLHDLCRGVIVSNTSYDGIANLPIPKQFHKYLRYYHYKTPVRCTNFQ